MCMSPDEMSDDRIREAIDYYRDQQRVCEETGHKGSARYHQATAIRFEILLAEREAQRKADVEEVFAAVVIDEPELVAA